MEAIDEQVDARFRDMALALYQADKISTGKLAEWFFTPRHMVENYFDELARTKRSAIDGPSYEEEPEAVI